MTSGYIIVSMHDFLSSFGFQSCGFVWLGGLGISFPAWEWSELWYGLFSVS